MFERPNAWEMVWLKPHSHHVQPQVHGHGHGHDTSAISRLYVILYVILYEGLYVNLYESLPLYDDGACSQLYTPYM